MFINNKGFSLVEVLVTVGLIGVLTAIAVPAYNKYKDGTNLMAMKADLGNGMKTYTAYDAISDTFCASFKDVGFSINSSSPVWKRNAFIGFGAIETTDCSKSLTDSTDYTLGLQYQSGSGKVTTNTECTAVGGTWSGTPPSCSKDLSAFAYKGSSVPAACKLGADAFIMGAASESAGTSGPSGATNVIQISDGGAIKETSQANCVP